MEAPSSRASAGGEIGLVAFTTAGTEDQPPHAASEDGEPARVEPGGSGQTGDTAKGQLRSPALAPLRVDLHGVGLPSAAQGPPRHPSRSRG